MFTLAPSSPTVSLPAFIPQLSFVSRATPLSQTCPQRRAITAARMVPLPSGIYFEVVDSAPSLLESPPKIPPTREKPALIFIHGSLHAAWCYTYLQQFFSKHGYQSYAISIQGAGKSKVPENGIPTIEHHISSLTALLSEFQLSVPPVIVGHSSGAFLIQKWVEQMPNLMSAMILLAPAPPKGYAALGNRIKSKAGFWTTLRITFGFIFKLVSSNVSLCREMFFSAKEVDGFSEELEGDEQLRTYMKHFKSARQTIRVECMKKGIQATASMSGNVLVIGGADDLIVDQQAIEETAAFWNGQYHIIEHAPHDLMLCSKWQQVAHLMLAWLEERPTNS